MPHLVGERARGLTVAAAGGLVAVSADALVEKLPALGVRTAPVAFELGERARASSRSSDGSPTRRYQRVDTVEERGDFSVRGGMIDVFPTTGREPIRIEFFGDEVERLSAFSVFTQRSLRSSPARSSTRPSSWPTATRSRSGASEDEGPAIPAGLAALGPELARTRRWWRATPSWSPPLPPSSPAEAADHLRDPDLRARGYVRTEEVDRLIEAAGALEELPLGQPYQFEAQPPALASIGIAEAENELRALVRAGYRVLVAFPHIGEADRTRMALNRVEVHAPAAGDGGAEEPGVAFVSGTLRHGVVYPALRLAVLTSAQLFRRRAARAPLPIGRALAAFGDLRPGDYVVHEDHGDRPVRPLRHREVAGVIRDYLYLEFRGEDRLYVPHEQLGKVSRYIGSGRPAPQPVPAGRQGVADAASTRVRTAVRELAGELLALYAQQAEHTRPPFPGDER